MVFHFPATLCAASAACSGALLAATVVVQEDGRVDASQVGLVETHEVVLVVKPD
jgi:hypothetical protein